MELIKTRIEIEWLYWQNDKSRDDVAAILREHLALFPRWVQRLKVTRGSGDDNVADILLTPKYRCATLTVYPSWFVKSAEEQRETIIHEIVHSRHGCMHVFAIDHLIDQIKGDNAALGEHLEAEYTEIMEAITEEWAFTMMEILHPHGTVFNV